MRHPRHGLFTRLLSCMRILNRMFLGTQTQIIRRKMAAHMKVGRIRAYSPPSWLNQVIDKQWTANDANKNKEPGHSTYWNQNSTNGSENSGVSSKFFARTQLIR